MCKGLNDILTQNGPTQKRPAAANRSGLVFAGTFASLQPFIHSLRQQQQQQKQNCSCSRRRRRHLILPPPLQNVGREEEEAGDDKY
jgi:hypothetical protein